MIPILLAHFRRSDRGLSVMLGYLVSCSALLALSSALTLWSQGTLALTRFFGVPVKDTATQSGQFAACAFVLLFLAIEMFRQSPRSLAAGMAVLALIFLANILVLARADLTIVPVAGLVIIPVLLILLGFKTLRARGMFGLLAVGVAMGTVAWVSSPQLRHATVTTWDSIQPYPGNHQNPAGARPEFWKKSLRFVCDAPAWGTAPVRYPGSSLAPPPVKPVIRRG